MQQEKPRINTLDRIQKTKVSQTDRLWQASLIDTQIKKTKKKKRRIDQSSTDPTS